jgi:hypothetical protein
MAAMFRKGSFLTEDRSNNLEKWGFYVRTRGLYMLTPIPRHLRRGPARREHQTQGVEKDGYRNKIMKCGILFHSPLDANMHLTDYFVKEVFPDTAETDRYQKNLYENP